MAQIRHLVRDGSQPELWNPTSSWTPYDGPLPRLSNIAVGIDTEERDGGLSRDMGPGWCYDDGHVCGVSVAWGDRSIYVPVRHPDTECRPVGEVVEWLDFLLGNCECHFFNAGYDLAWLWEMGCRVWPERMHDAYISSVMLDENHFEYDLDVCCARAGIAGKDQSLLEQAAVSYGVEPKSGLWRMPARFVGPYAEQDAAATLALSRMQLSTITEQGQLGAYQTEVDLVRVIYEMRKRGIRINTSKAEQSQRGIIARRDRSLQEISRLTGWQVSMSDLRSPQTVGRVFQEAGIECPRTKPTKPHPQGLPSVTKEWLAQLEHPLGGHVRAARRFDDLANKFLGTYILEHQHRGRIHANIHQLRDSEGGTRSHRLSYSSPPLQQTPARPDKDDPPEDKELVKEVRSAFEPESGEVWFAPDYSGQEPRFLVHIAAICGIRGGEEMAQRYRENPRLDYHQTIATILGWPRAQAKDTNQGLAYGMGQGKLARTLNVDMDTAGEKLEQYHEAVPYVKGATEHCANLAKSRGWIRLVDGARCHFDMWAPDGDRNIPPVKGLQAAQERWPNARRLVRVGVHKALNRGCQGGSARQMKRAMVAAYKAGILPLIQMHDELGFSISQRREAETAVQCMIEAVKLRVPMLVDAECGPDWGHAKMTLEEAGLK